MKTIEAHPKNITSIPSSPDAILDWHYREMTNTIRETQQKERSMIGHELHDNINQLLTVAKLFIESMPLQHPDNQQMRDRAVDTLMLAMEEIRNLSGKMVTLPETKGFLGAVLSLVNDINQTNVFHLRLRSNNHQLEWLSAEKKTALFRIIQEQMNNTIRHSKASEVTISLKCVQDQVVLRITDNGVGFDQQEIKKGVGLPGINRRAKMYNGEAVVKSSVGHGCSLIVRLPFD